MGQNEYHLIVNVWIKNKNSCKKLRIRKENN